MPIYEYKCQQCGEITEKLKRQVDADTETCDHCDGESRRIVSQSSIRFKGSGWYATDYGNSSEDPQNQESSIESDETEPSETSQNGE